MSSSRIKGVSNSYIASSGVWSSSNIYIQKVKNKWDAGGQSAINFAGGIINEYQVNNIVYRSHTFLTSDSFGIFNTSSTIELECFLVAGGGGGGSNGGVRRTITSGGGGGGCLSTILNLDPTQNSNNNDNDVVIGEGGALETQGGNSTISFNNIILKTAVGGGYGGSKGDRNKTGGNGGSGGGNGGIGIYPGSTYLDQERQGYDGRVSYGGGGGATGIGLNNVTISPRVYWGHGGPGIGNDFRDGTTQYYGGGGGGGADGVSCNYGGSGGIGGGGKGGRYLGCFATDPGYEPGIAGTPNTGGGGGGGARCPQTTSQDPSWPVFIGKEGGSGIVIIRYKYYYY